MDYESAEYVNQRQLLINEMLSRRARIHPDKEALVYEDRRYTYKDYDERTDRLANALMDRGIEKDDKVADLFFNCSEQMEVYMGVLKTGGVNVPLNFRLIGNELLYQITNSDSRIVIFGDDFNAVIDEIREEIPEVKFICVGSNVPDFAEAYEDVLSSGSDGPPGIVIRDDDPAFIMYTSGTTGRPKGAVLSHKNQMLNAYNCTIELLTVFDKIEDERVQFCAPLFHEAALAVAILNIFLGNTLCIMKFFEPEKVVQHIQDEKITGTLLVPAMSTFVLNMVDVSKYDTSSLKLYVTGAAILPTETRKQIMETFPGVKLFDVFGQTEMSPATCTLKPDDAFRKTASVGLPIINVEVRVVDDDDQDVKPGEAGEAVYRGPTVMKEYYKNPEATEETLRGGWFHSGDVVRQDEEGFFYVVDRKKDMIISGGENIYPAEIEEVLYQNPKILEAAVIGIFDETWGESVMAVVVPKEGEELTEKEVKDWCGKSLAGYKRPRYVEFVDALPRNPSMKVIKYALREKYGKSIRYE